MTIELKPEQEGVIAEAIQAGLIHNPDEVLALGLEALRARLARVDSGSARQEAVRRMLEFGEKNQLSLGEPITRALLHEGHRH